MKIVTSIIFAIGASMLLIHIVRELAQPGLYSDPATQAIGVLVMAGVAHLIWGEK